jgi:probable FeS assembly SUF system protein SufT
MAFMIPSGTGVEITQAKGNAVTININGQLARIDAKDADALGLELQDIVQPNNNAEKIATGPVDLEEVWDQLKTCFDPEIPVNIVDLGLIYDCRVESNEDHTHNHVFITMTLTAPGCGMGPILLQDAENAVWRVKNVTAVTVEMVFDPVWNRDMISEAAKLELGLL